MKPLIWGLREAEYFSLEDWTTQISLKRFRKFVFRRMRFGDLKGHSERKRDQEIDLILPGTGKSPARNKTIVARAPASHIALPCSGCLLLQKPFRGCYEGFPEIGSWHSQNEVSICLQHYAFASPMRRLVRLAAFRCHCRTRVEPATTKESIAILSDFFVASPEQAERYDNRTGEPDGGSEIAALLQPTSYTGFTSLQIEMLWAILEGVAWNVKQHTLETISFLDEGTWLQRFPTELTQLLAGASADRLASALVEWAGTIEVAYSPEDLAPVLKDLEAFAKQAVATNASVDLWGSV